MSYKTLLDKLIQIERSLGVETNLTVHKMLLEVEEHLLQMEKDLVDELRRGGNLSIPERPLLSEYQLRHNPVARVPDSILAALKSKLRELA